MPIDPNIPLASQYNAPSPQGMMSLAAVAQQFQQQQQQVAAQNKLREIYSQPDALDDQGNLKNNALIDLMRVDPATGMQVQQNQLRQKHEQLQTDMLTSDLFQDQMKTSRQIFNDARSAYEGVIRNGGSQEQATKAGQDIQTEGIENWKKSGRLGEEAANRINTKFDPNRIGEIDAAHLNYEKFLADQEYRKQELLQRGKQINIEAGRQTPTQAATAALKRADPNAPPGAFIELTKRSAPGKWTVKADPNHLDANGNPTQYRYNENTGESTGLDNSPLGFTPSAAVTPTAATSGVMSGRESVMLGRVMTAAQDTMKDLGNIMELPVTTSTGFFGGRKQGPSLFDATKEVLVNNVTSQEVQDFNVHTVGLGRAMASIESMGLAPNQHFQDQFDRLMLKEGDSQFTKLRKLASIRQQVESGIDTALASPRISKDQKTLLENAQKKIAEDVPFTPHDITELERSKNPKMSMRQMATSKGLGEEKGAEKEAAPPQSGKSPFPQFPDAKQAPDGKWYVGPDENGKYRPVNP